MDYLGQPGGVRVVPGVVHHAGESIQKVAQVLVPLQLGRLGWFDDWLWWGRRRGHGPVVLLSHSLQLLFFHFLKFNNF